MKSEFIFVQTAEQTGVFLLIFFWTTGALKKLFQNYNSVEENICAWKDILT